MRAIPVTHRLISQQPLPGAAHGGVVGVGKGNATAQAQHGLYPANRVYQRREVPDNGQIKGGISPTKAMGYWYSPHYVAAISPSIWALVMPTFAYMIYRAVRGSQAGLFGAAWFIGTYLVWIPISLITDRVSYVFYFYPTIGAICLGMGLGLAELLDIFKKRKPGKLKWTLLGIVIIILVAHLVSFVILSPVFPVARLF